MGIIKIKKLFYCIMQYHRGFNRSTNNNRKYLAIALGAIVFVGALYYFNQPAQTTQYDMDAKELNRHMANLVSMSDYEDQNSEDIEYLPEEDQYFEELDDESDLDEDLDEDSEEYRRRRGGKKRRGGRRKSIEDVDGDMHQEGGQEVGQEVGKEGEEEEEEE